MSRPVVQILVAAAVLAGCSSGDDQAEPSGEPSAPPTTEPAATPSATTDPSSVLVAPEWEPSTRAEQLVWETSTSPEGPTLQQAIDSFGLLVPDFPGVTPSDLPTGEIGDTSTIALITSMRDRLSAEQRAVLDDFTTGDTLVGRVSPDGVIVTEDTAAGSSDIAGWRRSGVPTPADYPGLLAAMRQSWVDHLGDAAPGHHYEIWVSDAAGSDGMTATPSPVDRDVCIILVHPEFAFKNPSADKVRWWLAHELFHCMQFRWAESAPFWNPHRWVTEGSADWAVADLFRDRAVDADYMYTDWFDAASRPLGGREYDAWPLYESAARNGSDVYGSIIRMMREPVAGVEPMLSVGHLDGLLSRIDWATRALRDLAYGQDWWLDWPMLGRESSGPTKTSLAAGPIGLGLQGFVGPGHFSQQAYTVEWAADVDVVTVFPTGSPLVTFTAAGTQVIPDGSWARLCFDPAGCVCPNAGADESWPMIDRSMLVTWAASEGRPRARAFADEWNPDEQCDDPEPDQGWSNGDPHLLSFDGLPFDVNALGEFVLARDPAGDFEVQTRHAPIGFGTGTTAVAVGDGTTRVTFTMPGFFAADEPTIRVDGDVTTATAFLAGDLRITVAGDEATAAWPDGSTATLDWYVGWFVTITVPPERSSRMKGLLGAADGDLRNDLRLPDGSLVDTIDAAAPDAPYALAWAVDESTTLFDYEPGESVATFRVARARPDPPVLDGAAIEACTAALGAAAAHDVAACAYDVSATGDTGFVERYVDVVEERASNASLEEPLLERPTTAPVDSAAAPVPGGGGEPAFRLSVDAPAGSIDAVAGAVVVARALGDCGDLHVSIEVTEVDGDGFAVASLCDVQDLGDVGLGDDDEWFEGEAYVWIPANGTYNVGLSTSVADAEALGPVDVYVDATPVVVDADALSAGHAAMLDALADTVVYLPDPATTFALTGGAVACVVEVYSGAPFPDPEPRHLGACEHDDAIDFPPTDQLIPVVVFNRTGDPIEVELVPS